MPDTTPTPPLLVCARLKRKRKATAPAQWFSVQRRQHGVKFAQVNGVRWFNAADLVLIEDEANNAEAVRLFNEAKKKTCPLKP